jgi:deazaflavin-dependent oxidoreductase (nitroreductase family)
VTEIDTLSQTEFCCLTTRGRRSGNPHRIEIWFVAHGGGAYLLSNSGKADWCLNLIADPHVTLEIDGQRRDTVARPVEASDPANAVVRPAMVAKYQPGYAQEDLHGWAASAWLARVEWPA